MVLLVRRSHRRQPGGRGHAPCRSGRRSGGPPRHPDPGARSRPDAACRQRPASRPRAPIVRPADATPRRRARRQDWIDADHVARHAGTASSGFLRRTIVRMDRKKVIGMNHSLRQNKIVNEAMEQGRIQDRRGAQYALATILAIWALAALPMGMLGWIVFPLLAPEPESDPLGSAVTRLVLLTLGLIWLFILSMIIVCHEEGGLRWVTVKHRLRLNAPREPTTGGRRAWLWLWVLPFLIGVAMVDVVLNPRIEHA